MILPDVNVLVYAFRREAERHERYAAWLARLVAGADELALHDTVLTAVARVVTNPKIFADPAPMPVALDFLGRIRAQDAAQALIDLGRESHRYPPGGSVEIGLSDCTRSTGLRFAGRLPMGMPRSTQ